MTADQMEQIRARLAAITPGEWSWAEEAYENSIVAQRTLDARALLAALDAANARIAELTSVYLETSQLKQQRIWQLERDDEAQVARIAALESAFHGVLENDPESFNIVDGVYAGRCEYCHQVTYQRVYIDTADGFDVEVRTPPHAPDCAWEAARKLVPPESPSEV